MRYASARLFWGNNPRIGSRDLRSQSRSPPGDAGALAVFEAELVPEIQAALRSR
jgi:hypothetical protein